MKENKEFDLNKSLQKAKMKQLLKTVSVAVLVVCLLLGVGYWGSQKLLQRKFMSLFDSTMDWQTISSPNTQLDSQTTEGGGLFSGEMVTHQSKQINGYVVPWQTLRTRYSLTSRGERDYNSLMTGWYESDKGDFYEYNRATKQKSMSFFSPHVKKYVSAETELVLPNDLPKIAEQKDHVIEVGLSFDQPYTVAEIEKRIPANLTIAWYWFDSYVAPESDNQAMPGEELVGITPYRQPKNKARKLTQNDLDEALQAAKRLTKANDIAYLSKFVKENEEKKPDQVKLAGIVLTGQTQNFAALQEKDWIRASSAGVSVPIVPYIKPEK